MPAKKPVQIKQFCPSSRKAWRNWLQKNHDKAPAVWLIYYKKSSGKKTVTYNDAVDEALCFGWIDSKSLPLDDERSMQYFCPRKPKSIWSKINKQKVEQLVADGLMTPAGMAPIEIARQNGYWNLIDDAEALIIPPDLEKAFKGKKAAKDYFDSRSRTDKRNMLQWLILAKRSETREKRVAEIVRCAILQQKPKPFA